MTVAVYQQQACLTLPFIHRLIRFGAKLLRLTMQCRPCPLYTTLPEAGRSDRAVQQTMPQSQSCHRSGSNMTQ